MSDERQRLVMEWECLAMANANGATPDELAVSRKRRGEIQARLLVLQGIAREEAVWLALSDERRLELMELCCRTCGTLDRKTCRCRYTENDE